ncbi:hypothetical protein BDP27DRAFT_1419096 [Rhodocollybia butyracea]|uniref:DUF6532 domain-containing protein n=1 Tax=Rhodocollybia butyracea TaxID=206335 RepID=A0A9P5U9T5_9AGAR|nr:hypothetical protein BDP27DRAFT_1419096 [Rhodocollybia butyracea]
MAPQVQVQVLSDLNEDGNSFEHGMYNNDEEISGDDQPSSRSIGQNPPAKIPSPQRRHSTRKRKKNPAEDQAEAELLRLKQKNAQLQLKKAKSKLDNSKGDSAVDDNELESEKETYKAIDFPSTATPLPSISSSRPQLLNLDLVKQRHSTQRPVSRNAFRFTPTSSMSPSQTASASERSTVPQRFAPQSSSSLTSTSRAPTPMATTAVSQNVDTSLTLAAPAGMARQNSKPVLLGFTVDSDSLVFEWRQSIMAKAIDYTPEHEALLLRAIWDYEAQILGKDFFPDSTIHIRWAEKAFRAACVVAKLELSSDKRAVKLNCEDWIGYAEHPSVITLLGYIFENGIGTVFEEYFEVISLKTLASLFTMVRAMLTEWATGKRTKIKKFSKEDHRKFYEAYLEDLTKWDSMNPIVSSNIRRCMFKKARDKVGVNSPDKATSHISGGIEDELCAQMEARTSETESESEASESGSESDVDGGT